MPELLRARPDISVQRGTRPVVLTPKYGEGRREVEVSYSWSGSADTPTVIVQGGISADREVTALDQDATPGWWQALVGAGAAIDLARWRVLAIDWLDAGQLGVDAVSSEDQADALAALLQALGVTQAHAFIGSSYGAMVALAFGARHPRRVGRLVLLAGAHRPHPLSTAQRSVQRGIVRLGQASGQVGEALALARQLAITTYRGSAEFGRRFAGTPELRGERFHFPVEDYLEHQGRRFVERFDAERFLVLSESIDLHDVAPEEVPVPATLIGFPSDRLVPLADLCELQRRLRGPATLEVVESPYGHDAFLKETEQLAPLLREALA
ncbi:MAG: homoserine O-succinyltransferase [Rhodanobacter sp.]|nr:MAG: homoserine O-succinyltransferase [Rhodanobacter sp.]TAM04020.1 MAG: homoserine O-succinyltransferase [Rhodanobacter sp.]TAM39911.1 MAG: homoserine O-succinyltransferase [Rhodanobacter sp.]TAN27533.1 MAG: homoserine O-succinyltransferase [Rhodanobacter sp.]